MGTNWLFFTSFCVRFITFISFYCDIDSLTFWRPRAANYPSAFQRALNTSISYIMLRVSYRIESYCIVNWSLAIRSVTLLFIVGGNRIVPALLIISEICRNKRTVSPVEWLWCVTDASLEDVWPDDATNNPYRCRRMKPSPYPLSYGSSLLPGAMTDNVINWYDALLRLDGYRARFVHNSVTAKYKPIFFVLNHGLEWVEFNAQARLDVSGAGHFAHFLEQTVLGVG